MADFRKSFLSDGEDLEFLFLFHNSGKTPAMAYEVYGEGGPALPASRDYSNDTARLEIDISVQADAIGEFGSSYFGDGASAVWGYVKYRDIFGDDHIRAMP